MRSIALALAACVTVAVAVACNSDDSSDDSSQSPIPPASCGSAPCSVGTICYGPSEPTCDGTWYCWSDTKWHCAPPDGGGPAGPPPDASLGGDDASTPAEASTVTDAPPG